MLKSLDVRNFKSIKHLKFDFDGLNVFVGTNSSGKSSVLQSILLCSQNIRPKAGLNGDLISLGDYKDVKCAYSNEKEIEVNLIFDNGNQVSVTASSDWFKSNYMGEHVSECLDYSTMNFQYLSCQRIGPQKIYDKNVSLVDNLGLDGRYAISFLQKHKSDAISEKLCKNSYSYTLLSQVNWWLKYITETEIYTQDVVGADKVQAFYSSGDLNNLRPDNVGAGISYLVSILIECLAAPENGIIIIENPEIHLHPSAQSKVCEFLYYISKAGRQLFIETHSDHIFNGFRAGIANGEMDKSSIGINFLFIDEEHLTKNIVVDIGRMGRIENQHKDMFDQFDIDLNKMLGIRRPKE